MSDLPKLRIEIPGCNVDGTGHLAVCVIAVLAILAFCLFAYIAISDPTMITTLVATMWQRFGPSHGGP